MALPKRSKLCLKPKNREAIKKKRTLFSPTKLDILQKNISKISEFCEPEYQFLECTGKAENVENDEDAGDSNIEITDCDSKYSCSFSYPTPEKSRSLHFQLKKNELDVNEHEIQAILFLDSDSQMEPFPWFEQNTFLPPTINFCEQDVYSNSVNKTKFLKDLIVPESYCYKHDSRTTNYSNKNAIKSSLRNNGANNPKKWVTFNDIIQSKCEQNFLNDLYADSSTQFQSINIPETCKLSLNQNFSHDDASDFRNGRPQAISTRFIHTLLMKTDRERLRILIEQVKFINDSITNARNEILDINCFPFKSEQELPNMIS